MKIFLIFILLIAFTFISIKSKHSRLKNEQKVITTYSVSQQKSPFVLDVNFNKLDNYNMNKNEIGNVKFNASKILYIEIEKINKQTPTERSSFTFVPIKIDKKNVYISYITGYHGNYTFSNLRNHIITCDIYQCDFGLYFFDKNINYKMLNDKTKNFNVENAVVILLKSISDRMILDVINYNDFDISINICPYTNWVPKEGLLEFIPEDHYSINGYFEKSDKDAYIVVPLYKRNIDSNFISCGSLKQPTLNDIRIGYKTSTSSYHMPNEEDIDILNNEISCTSEELNDDYYTFTFTNEQSNYKNIRVMEKINVTSNKKFKLYSDQVIYIYEKATIENIIKKYNLNEELQQQWDIKKSLCIRKIKNNVKSAILPTLGNLKSMEYDSRYGVYYKLIKNYELDKKFTLKCLSKVEGKNKDYLDEFYSRSARFNIVKKDDFSEYDKLSSNELIFNSNNIDNFGEYQCKAYNRTKSFYNNLITQTITYFVPDNKLLLILNDIIVEKNDNQQISCSKRYGSHSDLAQMTINYWDEDKSPKIITQFNKLNDTIEIRENRVYYNYTDDVSGISLICTYETIFKTTFDTRQRFKFSWIEPNNNGIQHAVEEFYIRTVEIFADNAFFMISGVIISILVLCFLLIVVSITIKIKEKRPRNNDYQKLLGNKRSGISKTSSTSTSLTSDTQSMTTNSSKNSSIKKKKSTSSKTKKNMNSDKSKKNKDCTKSKKNSNSEMSKKAYSGESILPKD